MLNLAFVVVAVFTPILPSDAIRMRSAYDSAPTAPVNVPTVNPPAASALMLPPPLAPLPTSSIPPPLVPIPAITTVALPPSGFSAVLISKLPALFTIMRLVYTSAPTRPVKVLMVNPPADIPDMLAPPLVLPPTSSMPPPLVPTPSMTTVAFPPSGAVDVPIPMLPVL